MSIPGPVSANWRTRALVAGVIIVALANTVWAADWPQWGGVQRNFRCDGADLADKWPDTGPKALWSRPLGEGYSAIVGDGTVLYTMHAIREKDEKGKWKLEGEEVVVALDAATGKTAWEYKYPAPWTKKMLSEYGVGPHSTPLITGDRLITIGATAKLHCLDRKTGSMLWAHDLLKEFKPDLLDGGYGYGSSPLLYNDTVILPLGGKGQSLVAFKLADGAVAWKNQDFDLTYSSLILIDRGSGKDLVAFTGKEVAGFDPASGELRWKHAHPTQFGANISTPVWDGGHRLFISSAYGMGSRCIDLPDAAGDVTPKELWYNKKMKIHFGNGVMDGDQIIGSSGDMGNAILSAIDLQTGKFRWRQKGIGKANCLLAGDKLIVLDEEGTLILGRSGKDRFEQLAKAKVAKRNAWTVPTLIGKTLYLRDRKTIQALDLGAAPSRD